MALSPSAGGRVGGGWLERLNFQETNGIQFLLEEASEEQSLLFSYLASMTTEGLCIRVNPNGVGKLEQT